MPPTSCAGFIHFYGRCSETRILKFLDGVVARRTFWFCWMNPLVGFCGWIARNCGEKQILSSWVCSAHYSGRVNICVLKTSSVEFERSFAQNGHFGSFCCENCRKPRNARFGSFFYDIWRRSRRKSSFWKFLVFSLCVFCVFSHCVFWCFLSVFSVCFLSVFLHFTVWTLQPHRFQWNHFGEAKFPPAKNKGSPGQGGFL